MVEPRGKMESRTQRRRRIARERARESARASAERAGAGAVDDGHGTGPLWRAWLFSTTTTSERENHRFRELRVTDHSVIAKRIIELFRTRESRESEAIVSPLTTDELESINGSAVPTE